MDTLTTDQAATRGKTNTLILLPRVDKAERPILCEERIWAALRVLLERSRVIIYGGIIAPEQCGAVLRVLKRAVDELSPWSRYPAAVFTQASARKVLDKVMQLLRDKRGLMVVE
jgi:hypothetical protein